MQRIEKIILKEEALEMINSEINQYGIIETGGVLMGYVNDSSLYIEKISDGGPNAIHEDIYFHADSNYIDMFIDMEYANSGGKNRYIGEWHTHPQVEPEPSEKDITSLFEIAASSNDFCLLIIVGAVCYKPSSLLDQYIAIIKYKNIEKGYSLPIRIEYKDI